MRAITLPILILCLSICEFTNAQETKKAAEADPDLWTVYNRKVTYENDVIHLDAQASDGILWLNHSALKNGTIELDIKGKDTPGRSFVGVVFHGKDNSTFDGIYFRPFNFLNPERNRHSVQYISMPENDWSVLRNAYPGKYEHSIMPIPKPVDDWFHAKIVVDYPAVKVYINGSEDPTLEIDQISERKEGMVGLWVGYESEGWFRNVVITPKQ